jgi:hypothetical protein
MVSGLAARRRGRELREVRVFRNILFDGDCARGIVCVFERVVPLAKEAQESVDPAPLCQPMWARQRLTAHRLE